MMAWIAYVFFFLLGMFLSIQLVAALYSIIDHWYRIKHFRRRIIASILVWGSVFFGIGYGLSDTNAMSYFSGMLFLLSCHVFVAVMAPVLQWLGKINENRKYQAFLRREGIV